MSKTIALAVLFVSLQSSATLRITEICPRPDALDPNGKEGGWIELTNTGSEPVNLDGYAIIRWNRGKEDKKKNRLRLCSKELAPGGRTVVYASESYPNYFGSEEVEVYGTADGYSTEVMVFPKKINPKNYPNVALYKVDDEGVGKTLVETFIIPVDLPDNQSFAPGPAEATRDVSLLDGYSYQIGEAEPVETSGRLTVTTAKVPFDVTEGLVALTASVDGSVAVSSAADTLDANGVLQQGAYEFSGVSAGNCGIRMTPAAYPADYYTVSLWFRAEPFGTESGANTGMPLFECRPSKTENRTGMIVFLNDDEQITIQPRIPDDTKTYTSDTEVNYADDNWHHLVLVAGQKQGDNLQLFIDGKREFSGVMPFDCALQTTIPYCFGHPYDSTSWHLYNGQLADIRVYNRALSATEVTYLAQENAALREVTAEYGGFTCKTNATTVSSLTYNDETDTFTFADGTYNSLQAYVENANQVADTLCKAGETLSFWIRPTSFGATGTEAVAFMDARNGSQASEGYLLLYGTDSSNANLYNRIYVQRGGSKVTGGLRNISFDGGESVPLDDYTHVAIAIDAATTNATLYVNGRSAGTSVLPYYAQATTTRRFGGTHDKFWRGFRGEMAEIKIFPGVLPEREIVKIYNASALSEATEEITESGLEGAVTVDELSTVTGSATVQLPAYVDGATLTIKAPETIGTLTVEKGGEAIELNSPIALDESETEVTIDWTLESEGALDTISLDLEAVWSAPVTGVTRAIMGTMTKGTENDYTGAIPYGPNIGPTNQEVFEDFGYYLPEPTATISQDFTVVLDIHPLSDDPENAIQKVELMYRADFGEVKFTNMTYTADAFLRTVEEEDENGEDVEVEKTFDAYVGVVPAADIPASGKLIQFGARITDGAGREWISPSRNNPDDCPNWYGTIVTPTADQLSKHDKLQTFHLFVEGESLTLMDKDYSAVEGTHPLGARCGIYDSQTDTYYDNVRIDLRGNTTAGFAKKSHGLRFSKCQPLTCRNMLEGGKKGTKLKEIRKTSFIAEFADPTFIRQALSFYVWRNAGNKVPFDYPVRLNLNGEFYQLAFHSNRFTDELIEDYYGLDPMGYGYKNVGTISTKVGTSAGEVEKKTPDDGDETSATAYAPLKAFAETFASSEKCPENDATLTQVVYDTFDIPAWINYLATARITQEADDIWANICLYWDKNGNDVWMPLAYDHNLSWGTWYFGDDPDMGRIGLRPDDDNFKSHPFYSGWKIRAHKSSGATVGNGNYAVEALWQNEDFREMYLRRLRTLMDEFLKAPGTAKADTPFWNDYVANFKEIVAADAALDRAKWGTSYASTVIYVWNDILEWDEAYKDLWENYIVKRRVHLYDTHSITNTAKTIGYASDLNAGIPLSHPEKFAPILIEKIDGGVKLTNPNTDSIDLSGWTLEGMLDVSTLPEDSEDVVTLPPGTVLLGGKSLSLAYDRKTFVAANDPCFVIGLAVYGDDKTWIPEPNAEATAIVLKKANGDVVVDDLVPAGVAAWLNAALENGAVTVDSISAITKAADYEVAYLLNELPSSGIAEATELDIKGFMIDEAGNIVLDVSLDVNGAQKDGTINGCVRLYSATAPTGPWSATDVTQNVFTDGAAILKSALAEPATDDETVPCFFKVRITP